MTLRLDWCFSHLIWKPPFSGSLHSFEFQSGTYWHLIYLILRLVCLQKPPLQINRAKDFSVWQATCYTRRVSSFFHSFPGISPHYFFKCLCQKQSYRSYPPSSFQVGFFHSLCSIGLSRSTRTGVLAS